MTHPHLLLLSLLTLSMLIACDEKPTPHTPSSAEPVATAESGKKAQGEEGVLGDTRTDEDATKTEAPAAALQPSDPRGAQILGIGSTPEDIAPGTSHVYGSNFTIIEPPLTLASAIEKVATDGEGPYKVEATVEKVCQKKGCWFTLKGEDVELPIRVKMKDYKFFVPRNATDLPVVLEGTFEKTTIPQAEAQHYADDEAENTGKPARKVQGDQDSWIFTAVAVQIDYTKS